MTDFDIDLNLHTLRVERPDGSHMRLGYDGTIGVIAPTVEHPTGAWTDEEYDREHPEWATKLAEFGLTPEQYEAIVAESSRFTVRKLRKLIADLPDEMEVWSENGVWTPREATASRVQDIAYTEQIGYYGQCQTDLTKEPGENSRRVLWVGIS